MMLNISLAISTSENDEKSLRVIETASAIAFHWWKIKCENDEKSLRVIETPYQPP